MISDQYFSNRLLGSISSNGIMDVRDKYKSSTFDSWDPHNENVLNEPKHTSQFIYFFGTDPNKNQSLHVTHKRRHMKWWENTHSRCVTIIAMMISTNFSIITDCFILLVWFMKESIQGHANLSCCHTHTTILEWNHSSVFELTN